MRTLDNINYNGKDVLEAVKAATKQVTSKRALDEALVWSSRYGQLLAMKYLVGIGADVNASDNEAIKHTSRKGYLEATEYLISQGANPTAGNNFPVREAARNNHPQTVKLLVEQGANIEDNNGPGSLSAVQRVFFLGHMELLRYFIEDLGISANAYNNYALRCAISHGRTEVVKYLKSIEGKN